MKMEEVARFLSTAYTLRTGGASGADSAFIRGSNDNTEIYVPKNGFNGFYKENNKNVIIEIPEEAFTMAEKYHPAYSQLSPFVKRLMARNCMQIFGKTLDNPVDFVICYTNDGKFSGGTGQALRLAYDHKIKIYNLYNKEDFQKINRMLQFK
jgi:hypothetical protein